MIIRTIKGRDIREKGEEKGIFKERLDPGSGRGDGTVYDSLWRKFRQEQHERPEFIQFQYGKWKVERWFKQQEVIRFHQIKEKLRLRFEQQQNDRQQLKQCKRGKRFKFKEFKLTATGRTVRVHFQEDLHPVLLCWKRRW